MRQLRIARHHGVLRVVEGEFHHPGCPTRFFTEYFAYTQIHLTWRWRPREKEWARVPERWGKRFFVRVEELSCRNLRVSEWWQPIRSYVGPIRPSSVPIVERFWLRSGRDVIKPPGGPIGAFREVVLARAPGFEGARPIQVSKAAWERIVKRAFKTRVAQKSGF